MSRVRSPSPAPFRRSFQFSESITASARAHQFAVNYDSPAGGCSPTPVAPILNGHERVVGRCRSRCGDRRRRGGRQANSSHRPIEPAIAGERAMARASQTRPHLAPMSKAYTRDARELRARFIALRRRFDAARVQCIAVCADAAAVLQWLDRARAARRGVAYSPEPNAKIVLPERRSHFSG